VILINGAPGAGKSTIAHLLAQRSHLTLALDVDNIKHALGQWDVDAATAGLRARQLALAMAADHIAAGHDVVLGQYLARTDFIIQLEDLARSTTATFWEFVLMVDADTIAARLGQRARRPERPEHAVNARLVSPGDAPDLVRSMELLIARRPSSILIDSSRTAARAAEIISRRLSQTKDSE
jgi:predicted kinase